LLLAAGLALAHRTRDGGLLEPPTPEEIARALGQNLAQVPSAAELQPRGQGTQGPSSPGTKGTAAVVSGQAPDGAVKKN
jgi:hypothetical protein